MANHTITFDNSDGLTESEMKKYTEDLNKIMFNTNGNLNRKDSIVLNCESETKMKALGRLPQVLDGLYAELIPIH